MFINILNTTTTTSTTNNDNNNNIYCIWSVFDQSYLNACTVIHNYGASIFYVKYCSQIILSKF